MKVKVSFICSLLLFFASELLGQGNGPTITLYGKHKNDTVHVYSSTNGNCYLNWISNYAAYDSTRADLTSQILIVNNVDCTVPGEYFVRYTVTDNWGRTDTAYRIFYVDTAFGLPNSDIYSTHNYCELFYSGTFYSLADSGAYLWEWTATSPSGLELTSNGQNPTFYFDEVGKWSICHRAKNKTGFSAWYCKNVWCVPPGTHYMGPNHESNNDSGILYDHGGPDFGYSNNRKKNNDYFSINTRFLTSMLYIDRLKLADTGDRLFIFQGLGDTGKAFHPAGGFTAGNFGKLPLIFVSENGNFFIQFESNGSGTDSGFVMHWKPGGSERVSGKVFYDVNADCEFNENSDIPIRRFNLSIGNKMLFINNYQGQYEAFGDTLSKIIKLNPPKHWKVACPINGVDTWRFSRPRTIDFGLKPDSISYNDMQTQALGKLGFVNVRGIKSHLWLDAKNLGNTKNDSIQCTLTADRKLEYLTYSGGSFLATDTTIKFFPPSIGLLNEKRFEIEYKVKSTDTGFVNFKCFCSPKGDANSSNDTSKISLRIVNAHDPNDKQVNAPQIYDQKDITFTYHVRFQNTGTAPATDVIIRDTLSPLLDTNSLLFEGSSHSCILIRDGYKLSFQFLGINLQDSNRNEPLSHGNLTYSIKPVTGLKQNQIIKNTAYIYFDAEKPVVTNTTMNWWATFPAIDLNTADTICHQINTAYISTLPTAKDKYYSQNEISIVKKGSVNAQVEGIYPEEYTATNAAGNSSKKTRYVHVKSCVNMMHLYSQDNIVISPMPVSDRIHIKLLPENVLDWTLNLYNTQGMLIHSSHEKAQMGELECQLANIPAGIYFMEILSENGHNKFRRNLVLQQ